MSAGVCGDGIVDANEVCDDLNTTAGDGCSASCTVEVGWACTRTAPSKCTHASCAGMTGTECNDGGDCCASPLVTGGSFTEDSGMSDEFRVTVSSFRLDKYEVTVARFRAFVNAYDAWRHDGNPMTGAGANPDVSDSGWQSDFGLVADAGALRSNLECDSTSQTWASTGNDTLPVNCVNWYEAFAFCIWDGGFLPTESEWEYAAAGGSQDWIYPWGNTPVPTNMLDSTADYAVYNCLGDGDTDCSSGDVLAVGSKPAGQGRYGQDDLAGSMWEWALDYYEPYPTGSITDYASVTGGSSRALRGGSWYYTALYLAVGGRRLSSLPTDRSRHIGFRCARAR
jgi:cysteine-rich repeat protein